MGTRSRWEGVKCAGVRRNEVIGRTRSEEFDI